MAFSSLPFTNFHEHVIQDCINNGIKPTISIPAMSQIYLLIGDAQKGPYSEEDLEKMYVAGTITAETLHWHEGMADWQMIGARDPRTGRQRTISSTIAPPRRSHSHNYVPPDLKVKNLKAEFPSARNRPIGPIGVFVLIGFFFMGLTFLIMGYSRLVPDAGKILQAKVSSIPVPKK